MKAKTQYVCQQCGASSPKWIGRCPSCQQWNTFVEERITAAVDSPASWDSSPVRFDEITGAEAPRVTTGIDEFDRVLGGGVVAGALVLVGGDPGIGKSTLLLQAAALAARRRSVLYLSGEESAQQLKMRAARLGLGGERLFVVTETNLSAALPEVESLAPALVIVDSIQTVYSEA